MKLLLKMFIKKILSFIICFFYKVDKDWVLFISFDGRQYSDNPRAISEELHRQNRDIKIFWLLNNISDRSEIPSYVNIIKNTFFNRMKYFAKSFCIVSNERFSNDFFKRKNQFIVQTWHGDRSFKKVLFDDETTKKSKQQIWDGKVVDLAISGSKFGTSVYRSAFHYYGEILECGSPRNDCLIENSLDKVNLIKRKIGINKSTKILLFAPTFRDKMLKAQDVNFNISQAISILEEQTGSKWVSLIRAHSASKGIVLPEDSDKCVDVSHYYDMSDLLLISDLLITDYSSSSFDIILKGTPVIIFAKDEKEYEASSRSFKVRPEDSGFLCVFNETELDDVLSRFNEIDWQKYNKKVFANYGIIETGRASKKTSENILQFRAKNW